ncbi:FAD:protein FMN transferase, partial [Ancrocorticia sp.]|uniref:FAD:protein FMN transferase n=1 Tax=Ancrocorticia sp. TaxID=2593684 RepID=UPI003F8F6E48
AAVLGAAKLYEHQTSGWFCALVGAQMREWDQRLAVYANGGEAAAPLSAKAPSTAEHGTRGRIELDGQWCRVTDAPARSVDLGGIAKGYAADRLQELARESGASDVLVSLGTSSIAVAGAPAVIGLASPWAGWDRIGSVILESGALAVSADPGMAIGSVRGHTHVLDPWAGVPATTDLCGAVVCGRDGMACEAFSTAYLAMGLEAAMSLDAQHPELDSIFMTIDGRLLASPNLQLRTAPGFQAWLADRRQHHE